MKEPCGFFVWGSWETPHRRASKKEICDEARILLDCEGSLLVELIPVDTPSDFPDDNAKCVDRGTKISPTISFDAGARAEVVFLRACIVVDPFTPLIGFAATLPKDSTGGTFLVATSAFMNEPE
ncbi:hypothetical protein [Consotaella salsifontis]|uniref:hypothetical protein n=1 Tax=Consotaella salsifontis TaxID=1365950 RepID=UPI0013F66B1A|nr:hypothetical protein [Consotaella salsifontis]